MVQHWKCCVRQRTAGSNPVLSAKNTENPAFYAGFSVFLAERTELKRSLVVRVPEGCLQPEEIRRGLPALRETALSCPVIMEKLCYISLPRILCGIFCVLAERTEMKGFLVVRVSALPTYAEAHTLAWETALSCPILSKDAYPHFMRDFLCFGGEDRAEGVPCGSRV